MSYEKQNWKTGDIVTANRLNHMEDGIESNVLVVNIQGDIDGEEPLILDKTWQQIYDSAYTIAIYSELGAKEFYPIGQIMPGGEYEGETYPYGVIFENRYNTFEFKTNSADGYPTRDVPK